MLKIRIGKEILLTADMVAGMTRSVAVYGINYSIPKIGLLHKGFVYFVVSIPGSKPTERTFETWMYDLNLKTGLRVYPDRFKRRDVARSDLQKRLLELAKGREDGTI